MKKYQYINAFATLVAYCILPFWFQYLIVKHLMEPIVAILIVYGVIIPITLRDVIGQNIYTFKATHDYDYNKTQYLLNQNLTLWLGKSLLLCLCAFIVSHQETTLYTWWFLLKYIVVFICIVYTFTASQKDKLLYILLIFFCVYYWAITFGPISPNGGRLDSSLIAMPVIILWLSMVVGVSSLFGNREFKFNLQHRWSNFLLDAYGTPVIGSIVVCEPAGVAEQGTHYRAFPIDVSNTHVTISYQLHGRDYRCFFVCQPNKIFFSYKVGDPVKLTVFCKEAEHFERNPQYLFDREIRQDEYNAYNYGTYIPNPYED